MIELIAASLGVDSSNHRIFRFIQREEECHRAQIVAILMFHILSVVDLGCTGLGGYGVLQRVAEKSLARTRTSHLRHTVADDSQILIGAHLIDKHPHRELLDNLIALTYRCNQTWCNHTAIVGYGVVERKRMDGG